MVNHWKKNQEGNYNTHPNIRIHKKYVNITKWKIKNKVKSNIMSIVQCEYKILNTEQVIYNIKTSEKFT